MCVIVVIAHVCKGHPLHMHLSNVCCRKRNNNKQKQGHFSVFFSLKTSISIFIFTHTHTHIDFHFRTHMAKAMALVGRGVCIMWGASYAKIVHSIQKCYTRVFPSLTHTHTLTHVCGNVAKMTPPPTFHHSPVKIISVCVCVFVFSLIQ